MQQKKDAFTYLQAGSKPKALEAARSADLRQMNEHGQNLMFAAAGRNKGSAELICEILQNADCKWMLWTNTTKHHSLQLQRVASGGGCPQHPRAVRVSAVSDSLQLRGKAMKFVPIG